MYRVVLIDDEQLIVEGLKKVVPWDRYDCEVVAEAEDAVSGAACIRKWKPDILFTDIRMPGMDGLTMLAGLRSEFPEMQITVLTGFREFGYAQEAIRLGVTRFLLKPSKMNEIEEALACMTERLGRRSSTEEETDAELSRYAEQNKKSLEDFKKMLSDNDKQYFAEAAATRKTIEFLKANAE